jgi:hypothetical protein
VILTNAIAEGDASIVEGQKQIVRIDSMFGEAEPVDSNLSPILNDG